MPRRKLSGGVKYFRLKAIGAAKFMLILLQVKSKSRRKYLISYGV